MSPELLELVKTILLAYPELSILLALIGLLRTINKPLFSFLHFYVKKTKTTKDDELLEKVEKSATYKMYLYLLDWLTSIKPRN